MRVFLHWKCVIIAQFFTGYKYVTGIAIVVVVNALFVVGGLFF